MRKTDESSRTNKPPEISVSGSCDFKAEMFERLINSHFHLFRRLNQINNKEPQSEATQIALEEAREVNRFFSDESPVVALPLTSCGFTSVVPMRLVDSEQ